LKRKENSLSAVYYQRSGISFTSTHRNRAPHIFTQTYTHISLHSSTTATVFRRGNIHIYLTISDCFEINAMLFTFLTTKIHFYSKLV